MYWMQHEMMMVPDLRCTCVVWLFHVLKSCFRGWENWWFDEKIAFLDSMYMLNKDCLVLVSRFLNYILYLVHLCCVVYICTIFFTLIFKIFGVGEKRDKSFYSLQSDLSQFKQQPSFSFHPPIILRCLNGLITTTTTTNKRHRFHIQNKSTNITNPNPFGLSRYITVCK